MSLLSFTPGSDAISSRLSEIQSALTQLLGHSSELVQEMASRGLSVVYSLAGPEGRKDLIENLMGTLQGRPPHDRPHASSRSFSCLLTIILTCSVVDIVIRVFTCVLANVLTIIHTCFLTIVLMRFLTIILTRFLMGVLTCIHMRVLTRILMSVLMRILRVSELVVKARTRTRRAVNTEGSTDVGSRVFLSSAGTEIRRAV